MLLTAGQASPFTSTAFTAVLKAADVRISTVKRGRWMDDVFIERLWRSLKHACVDLHAFETGSELRSGLARGGGCSNTRRPHFPSAGRTPGKASSAGMTETLAA